MQRITKYRWIGLLALASILFACNPSKRAHQYFKDHPQEFAQDCADAYPVKETKDSSAYKASLRRIDSLNDAHRKDSLANIQEKDILMGDIKRLSSLAPPDCDSLSEAIYRYAASETKRADKAERKSKELTEAAKNVQPVTNTVENTAKTTAANQQLEECKKDLLKAQADRDFYKHKFETLEKRGKGKLVIYIPWTLIIILSIGLGGVIAMKLKGIALNPLSWFKK